MGVSAKRCSLIAYGGEKAVWLGDENGNLYRIDLTSGGVNKYRLPGIVSRIENLLVTDAGVVYISMGGRGFMNTTSTVARFANCLLQQEGNSNSLFVDKV